MEQELADGARQAAHDTDTKQRMRDLRKIQDGLRDPASSRYRPDWIRSTHGPDRQREAGIYLDIWQEMSREFKEDHPGLVSEDTPSYDATIWEIVVHGVWRMEPDLDTIAELKEFTRNGFEQYFQYLIDNPHESDGDAKDFLESEAEKAEDEDTRDKLEEPITPSEESTPPRSPRVKSEPAYVDLTVGES